MVWPGLGVESRDLSSGSLFLGKLLCLVLCSSCVFHYAQINKFPKYWPNNTSLIFPSFYFIQSFVLNKLLSYTINNVLCINPLLMLCHYFEVGAFGASRCSAVAWQFPAPAGGRGTSVVGGCRLSSASLPGTHHLARRCCSLLITAVI